MSVKKWAPVVKIDGGSCDCPDCRQFCSMGQEVTPGAIEKAEALLRRFCSTKQIRQWEQEQRLTVLGSDGNIWLLTPRHVTKHRSVVREDGLGVSVWPVNLAIAADWALSLKLYLEADEYLVVNSGCHEHYQEDCTKHALPRRGLYV